MADDAKKTVLPSRRDVFRVARKTLVGGAAVTAAYGVGVWDGKGAKRAPAQEEMDEMYRKVYEYLSGKKREADEGKKPLVVLVGDTPENEGRNPLALQLIAIDVASDLGIKTMAPQLSMEKLNKLQRGSNGVELVDVQNVEPAMRHAAKRRMGIKPIDTYIENKFKPTENRPDPSAVLSERNAEMASHLKDAKEGVLAVVEDRHLRGLMESDLAEKCHVAAVTTLTRDKHENWLRASRAGDVVGKGGQFREDMEFAGESPRVLRVPMNSKFEDSQIGRVAEMVQRARELYLRDKGLNQRAS